MSCDFPQKYSWGSWKPWECNNGYNRKTGVASWINFQETFLTIFMNQWWVYACISRNIWTIPMQGCCRASLFFREAFHTQTAPAPWPNSHILVQAGYVCAGISQSNSSVWNLVFPEGILCFSAVVDPGYFLLSFPSLGCGCSTCT